MSAKCFFDSLRENTARSRDYRSLKHCGCSNNHLHSNAHAERLAIIFITAAFNTNSLVQIFSHSRMSTKKCELDNRPRRRREVIDGHIDPSVTPSSGAMITGPEHHVVSPGPSMARYCHAPVITGQGVHQLWRIDN